MLRSRGETRVQHSGSPTAWGCSCLRQRPQIGPTTCERSRCIDVRRDAIVRVLWAQAPTPAAHTPIGVQSAPAGRRVRIYPSRGGRLTDDNLFAVWTVGLDHEQWRQQRDERLKLVAL